VANWPQIPPWAFLRSNTGPSNTSKPGRPRPHGKTGRATPSIGGYSGHVPGISPGRWVFLYNWGDYKARLPKVTL
jgi:hypothetical protein